MILFIEELEILIQKKNKRGKEACKAVFALFTDGKDNVSEGNFSRNE